MIQLSFSDLINILGTVTTFTVLLLIFMLLYSQRRKTKYDEDTHRIELELMRRSIESQMYELNEKLLATENRWSDVNHLLISSQNRQPDAIESTKQNLPLDLLRSADISIDDVTIERDLVFVLTPFHPNYNKEFEVISKVCNGLGLRAMRGDEEFVKGDVFPHILRLISRARIIIANINGRNPNVFYELGIAHTMGKPTILIASQPDDVPFDLRTKRLVLFKSQVELGVKLRDELARVVVKIDSTN